MKHKPIHRWFSETAEVYRERAAILSLDSRVTYGELESRSNNLANYLISKGATKGTIVAILAENPLDVITSIIGILKAGCVFVPLDPEAPEKRLQAMLSKVIPTWFVLESKYFAYVNGLTGARARAVILDQKELLDDSRGNLTQMEDFADYLNPAKPAVDSAPDDLCYVYFTSGSTGKPKGIAGRLKGIDHFIQWEIEQFGVRAGDRISQLTTLSFDASLRDIFVALCAGGTICVPGEREVILDAGRLIDWLDIEAINLVHCVPSVFRSIVNQELDPNYFASLKTILMAGEPLLPSDVKRWMDIFGERVQLVNLYGPTETTMTKLFYQVSRKDAERRTIPIGKPMPGARAIILDEQGRACPPQVIGEIFIRTPYRSHGYFNEPDLTGKAFLANPFSNDANDIIYKTGDLGRVLEDGNFEYLGRLDHQVKIRGVRVELGEIENVLRSLVGVEDVAVIETPEPHGSLLLTAYVVLREGVEVKSLREQGGSYLPPYMLPSRYVEMKELPRTRTGKIDRQGLPREQEWESQRGSRYEAPRTSIEELLSGIWSEVLGVERVGVEENFFELGGHSLLATQVMSGIRELLRVEMPLRSLFEKPTVRGLSEEIEKSQRGGEGGVRIERASRESELELSYAQQRLWFIDQLEGGSASYNVPAALRLKGEVNVSVLEQVMRELVRRHEVLRTTYVMAGKRPVQTIAPFPNFRLSFIDLSVIYQDSYEDHIQQMITAEVRRPFNLAVGPLLRVLLLRLRNAEYILLFNIHHIASDGWSTGLLVREFTSLFESFSGGSPSPLVELTIQYADFAHWQRGWLQGEVLDAQRTYWKEQLSGVPPISTLPPIQTRQFSQSTPGRVHKAALSQDLYKSLQNLSRREGVTLFMILLAALKVLLYRRVGQQDIAIGTVMANRDRAELNGLIGILTNNLVLRTDLSGNPTFRELLAQIREVCLDAYTNKDYPFEKLVEELQPDRDPSHHPLFQILFVLQNYPIMPVLEITGVRLSPVEARTGAARFDLLLNMFEADESLAWSMEYNPGLYEESTIAGLFSHYCTLLEHIVKHTDERIGSIPLAADSEGTLVACSFNENNGDMYGQDYLVQDLFYEVASKYPLRIAIDSADKSITYAELNKQTNILANFLLLNGATKGSVVAILADDRAQVITAILGTLKAGCIFVPLDPELPEKRLEAMIAKVRPEWLISESKYFNSLRAITGRLGLEAKVIGTDIDVRREDLSDIAFQVHSYKDYANAEKPAVRFSGDDVCYVYFTSGSTGTPKGIAGRLKGIAHFIKWEIENLSLDEDTRVSQLLPFSFDGSLRDIFVALCAGGTICVPEQRDLVLDTPKLIAWLTKNRVNVIHCVPSVFRAIINENPDRNSFLALKYILLAGEALQPTDIIKWTELFGERIQLINLYGTSETTMAKFIYFLGLSDRERRTIPIGKPMPGARAIILDEQGRACPPQVIGEIFIRTPYRSHGYFNEPDLTGKAFLANPFSNDANDIIYKTGDLGRVLEDGNFEYLGRLDHQVKIRGVRVELGEIENVLRSLVGVEDVAVIETPEPHGSLLLTAYVVLREGVEVKSLREQGGSYLPPYMLPSRYVEMKELPRTRTGKIDRQGLPREQEWESQRGSRYEAPRTSIEELLSGIWSEVLGVERVGVEENFFELGGHSLLATQVMSGIRELLRVEMPLRSLFEKPTVRGLSEEIEKSQRGGEGGVRIERASRESELELSYAQQRLWFIDQLEGGSASYNVPAALRLKGEVNVSVLEQVMRELVRRHEVLRTTFASVEERAIQIIHDAESVPVRLVNLRTLPEARRAAEAQRLIGEQARKPFNLACGPLFRVTLLQVTEEEHILLLTMHHIVSDAWSVGVLIQEVTSLYQAYSNGTSSGLAELTIQYADFAVWQRAWLQGQVLESHLDFWKRQLAGVRPTLNLPTSRPRPAKPTFRGMRQAFQLSAALSRELRDLSRREGVTLFMTLLAAFQTLLYRYDNADDIVVGANIANRDRHGTEKLIGFFINMLVMRTDFSGNPGFRQLLSRIREVALSAFAYQDLPFEKVVEELQPERDLSHSPLFRVVFNFNNTMAQRLDLAGLALERIPVERERANFDLTLFMFDDPHILSGTWAYNTDLFDAAAIKRISDNFLTLLQSIVAEPDARLTSLEMFSEAEKNERALREKQWEEANLEKLKRVKRKVLTSIDEVS
jgi:amino acid adenylation domain-containing protein